jgi:hypothetical protein
MQIKLNRGHLHGLHFAIDSTITSFDTPDSKIVR